jgi:hypothetical protein
LRTRRVTEDGATVVVVDRVGAVVAVVVAVELGTLVEVMGVDVGRVMAAVP